MRNIDIIEYVEEIRLDTDWDTFSDEELEEILEFALEDLE